MALASIVLPVPGGPTIRTPRSRLPPALVNSRPCSMSLRIRLISPTAAFWRHPLPEDERAPDDAQDAAGQQHCDHRVDKRPSNAQLQRDLGEGECRGADEDRKDPEDDHGGVKSLYVFGFRFAIPPRAGP